MQADNSHKLWTATFVVILLATLCSFIVGQGTNSGTSVFLNRIGGTAAFAGVLAAVFSAAAAIARIACGHIIDVRGRRPIMIVGALLMLAGTLGAAFMPHEGIFVLWRFLQGAGFSTVTTAAATAAADVLPAERLGEGIGYYGLGQAVSMSIGPALALFLVGTDPATNLYLGLSLSAFCALLFSLVLRYEKHPQNLPATSAYRRRWEHGAHNEHSNGEADDAKDEPTGKTGLLSTLFERRALPGAIPMAIICPAFGFGIFFVGLLGTRLGVGSPGLFYTISAVSMVLIRLASRSFMDTIAPIRVFAGAVVAGLITYGMLLGVACGVFSAGSAFGDAVFYAAGFFYGLTLGIALPANQAVSVKNTPPERWGACNALFLLFNDLGIGTASIIWGHLNDAFGFAVSICGVLVCIVLSYIAAWICYPPEAKRSPKR